MCFGNYSVYALIYIIIVLLAFFILYWIIKFLSTKDLNSLKWAEFVSAAGLFLSNMYALYHIKSNLGFWEYEGLKNNFETINTKTLAVGIQENYQRLYQEFYVSLFFFIILILVIFFKNYSMRKLK